MSKSFLISSAFLLISSNAQAQYSNLAECNKYESVVNCAGYFADDNRLVQQGRQSQYFKKTFIESELDRRKKAIDFASEAARRAGER